MSDATWWQLQIQENQTGTDTASSPTTVHTHIHNYAEFRVDDSPHTAHFLESGKYLEYVESPLMGNVFVFVLSLLWMYSIFSRNKLTNIVWFHLWHTVCYLTNGAFKFHTNLWFSTVELKHRHMQKNMKEKHPTSKILGVGCLGVFWIFLNFILRIVGMHVLILVQTDDKTPSMSQRNDHF